MQKTLQEVLVVFALWQVMEKLVDYAYFSKDEYRIAKNVLCGFEQLTVLASGVLGQLFSKIAINLSRYQSI
jgi:hypothetical protein